MIVRGAPAIGIAAAFGLALAAYRLAAAGPSSTEALLHELRAAAARLAATRPTAVNLSWALETSLGLLGDALGGAAAAARLEAIALAIWRDDVARCQAIGEHGAALIPDGATVLTHCNAGALATGGHGTALGVIRSAIAQGKRVRVVADETRPFLQGARLTAWELLRDGIDVTVIPDGAAAHLMARGQITCAIVGADRIAASADTANKIGTLGVALAAHAHGLPFLVAAPLSTVDLATARGGDVPIEERPPTEVAEIMGIRMTPPSTPVVNPAFDVTPARLITAIVTEAGVFRPPWTNFPEQIRSTGRKILTV
jgi:methylthioribose-1-phosphate isomerase